MYNKAIDMRVQYQHLPLQYGTTHIERVELIDELRDGATIVAPVTTGEVNHGELSDSLNVIHVHSEENFSTLKISAQETPLQVDPYTTVWFYDEVLVKFPRLLLPDEPVTYTLRLPKGLSLVGSILTTYFRSSQSVLWMRVTGSIINTVINALDFSPSITITCAPKQQEAMADFFATRRCSLTVSTMSMTLVPGVSICDEKEAEDEGSDSFELL